MRIDINYRNQISMFFAINVKIPLGSELTIRKMIFEKL